jgi:HD superfamily phosphohydrolase
MTAVESMRLARHHMHRTVYGHRNRLVTDFMLQRGIADALERELLPGDLLTVPDSASFETWWREYRTWDDWRMMTELATADGLAGAMFCRLRDHRLPKLLVHLDSRAFHSRLGLPTVSAFGSGLTAADESALETELARRLGQKPEEVIVRIFDPKRSLGRVVTDPIDDDDIIIVDETLPEPDRYEKFDARSEIFDPPRGEPMRELLVYSSVGRKSDPGRAADAVDWVITALRERASLR